MSRNKLFRHVKGGDCASAVNSGIEQDVKVQRILIHLGYDETVRDSTKDEVLFLSAELAKGEIRRLNEDALTGVLITKTI